MALIPALSRPIIDIHSPSCCDCVKATASNDNLLLPLIIKQSDPLIYSDGRGVNVVREHDHDCILKWLVFFDFRPGQTTTNVATTMDVSMDLYSHHGWNQARCTRSPIGAGECPLGCSELD